MCVYALCVCVDALCVLPSSTYEQPHASHNPLVYLRPLQPVNLVVDPGEAQRPPHVLLRPRHEARDYT